MKIRSGFVSNSSSSSFILRDESVSVPIFRDSIKKIWNDLYLKGECDKENLDQVSIFYSISFYSVKSFQKSLIKGLYSNECWSASEKINHEYVSKYDPFFVKIKKFITNTFSKTYLQEALKADIFGTSQENEIPYEVLKALKEKYGSKLIIHHLG